MSQKYDLRDSYSEGKIEEYLEHPDEGWLSYDPNTLRLSPHRDGKRPINKPIRMVGKFIGTKQPSMPTCSEPGEGNAGCFKWAACPFKNFKHIGPVSVIMKKKGTVSYSRCFDFFEVTNRGRPVTQVHYGLDGWELDTSRTTIDVLGSVPQTNKLGQKISVKKGIWEKEIHNLGPPWWGLLRKKGLPLPDSAERFPELIEGGESLEETSTPKPSRSRRSRRSA